MNQTDFKMVFKFCFEIGLKKQNKRKGKIPPLLSAAGPKPAAAWPSPAPSPFSPSFSMYDDWAQPFSLPDRRTPPVSLLFSSSPERNQSGLDRKEIRSRFPRGCSFPRVSDPIKLLATTPRVVFLSSPQKPCPRTSCCPRPKAEQAAARRELLPSFFGPSKAPPRVRGELLVPMVFSFRETVLGIEKPVVAGELLSAGNGSHRTGAGAGRPLATGPLDASKPSDQSWTARIKTYPFAAYFR